MIPLLFEYQEYKPVAMFPGVTRRALISGDKMMLTEFTRERDAKLPSHKHPHEWISGVIGGRYKIFIRGKEYMVEKKDSYLIPSNAEHYQETVERTVTVDVFSPRREEYKEVHQMEEEG